MRLAYLLILIGVLGMGGFSLEKVAEVASRLELPASQYGLLSRPYAEGTMLFGGDIMLARAVEDLMHEKGNAFPFEHIAPLVSQHDVAIANFEASIPEVHKKTISKEMRFSVEASALPAVHAAGFDILSLANNHALDHGPEGYEHTHTTCAEIGLRCVGHPVRHTLASNVVVNVGDTRVGILMLHTLFEAISTTTVSALINDLEARSDLQFIFIHWGTEYERIHSEPEEALAHFFIDEGIDAVIGHHPHVMQDIELYGGKPIFYSLGNLIFDQYFSKDVQEGFFVSLEILQDRIAYTLIPYDMHDVRTQPKLQTGDMLETTLGTLLNRQHFTLEETRTGRFEVAR